MSNISESASYNSIKVKAHIYVKTSIASCLISTGKNGKPSGSQQEDQLSLPGSGKLGKFSKFWYNMPFCNRSTDYANESI